MELFQEIEGTVLRPGTEVRITRTLTLLELDRNNLSHYSVRKLMEKRLWVTRVDATTVFLNESSSGPVRGNGTGFDWYIQKDVVEPV